MEVNGNGEYSSEDFVPSEAGTYRWTADYSGDEFNEPVSSGGNAEGETSVVNEAAPTGATEQNMTVGGETGEVAKPAKGPK